METKELSFEFEESRIEVRSRVWLRPPINQWPILLISLGLVKISSSKWSKHNITKCALRCVAHAKRRSSRGSIESQTFKVNKQQSCVNGKESKYKNKFKRKKNRQIKSGSTFWCNRLNCKLTTYQDGHRVRLVDAVLIVDISNKYFTISITRWPLLMD